MKIAFAQIDTTVGDFRGNVELVRAALDRGRAEGIDLVVFPEQTLPGYPAEDLLERRDFIDCAEHAFEQALQASRGIGMVLGTITRARGGEGNPVHNSSVLADDGVVIGVQHKTLLPTYDVFDEGRYFRPAESHDVFPFRGRKLGLPICEDLWNDPLFWPVRRYAVDPADVLVKKGADLLVSISASPFSLGRSALRFRMVGSIARRHGVEIHYVNLVGGNTTLIFDGASFAVGPDGGLISAAPPFEEAFHVFDSGSARPEHVPAWFAEAPGEAGRDLEAESAYRALVLGTRDYLRKSGFRRAVVGLSGGIDSALTAVIAAEALGPENVIGVSMPSRYSSEGSLTDARELAAALGIMYRVIPIEGIFEPALRTLAPIFEGRRPDVTEENMQARIRGFILMAISNKLGALLLTTGNKSELAVGYCTLYGDMSGGLAVISDVPKMLVYRIARWINRDRTVIPRSSIEKAPSAELRPDQKDEDSLPPYAVLDPILEAYIEGGKTVGEIAALGFDAKLVEDVIRLVDRNEYKRKQAAPGLRITGKAFGPGRRFPIVQRFRV